LLGTIVPGENIGQKIGFPTINLSHIKNLFPKSGVYCGYIFMSKDPISDVHLLNKGNKSRPAVFNLGVKPTLSNSKNQVMEGHILDYPTHFSKRLDGCFAVFYLMYRMRDEQKFSTIEDLKEQIKKDCLTGRRLLLA